MSQQIYRREPTSQRQAMAARRRVGMPVPVAQQTFADGGVARATVNGQANENLADKVSRHSGLHSVGDKCSFLSTGLCGKAAYQQLCSENLALRRRNQLLLAANLEREQLAMRKLRGLFPIDKPSSHEIVQSQLARLMLAAINPKPEKEGGSVLGCGASELRAKRYSGSGSGANEWNSKVPLKNSCKKAEGGNDAYGLGARKAVSGARRSLAGQWASSLRYFASTYRAYREFSDQTYAHPSRNDEKKKAVDADILRPSSSDMGSLATSLLGAIDRFQPVHNARFVLYSPSAGIFQADELDRIRDGELTLSDIIEASSKNISLERLRSDRSEAPQDPGSDVLHTGKHELNRTYVPESGCFWLDVTDPSPEEMRWLTRKFGIHPSTIEVILAAEETLDTFETFPDYNFLTYWTVDYKGESKSIHEFNQGTDRVVKACCSIVIMESCVLTFHGARNLSHLGNVIDRLRRLADPQTHQMPPLTPAYIAYALIDDITDMLVRLVRMVELDTHTLDELALILSPYEKLDLLQRIGAARRRILALSRLLQGKPEVLRRFIKWIERQAPAGELAGIEGADELGNFDRKGDPASPMLSPVSALSRNAYSPVNMQPAGKRHEAQWEFEGVQGLAPSMAYIMPSASHHDWKASEQPVCAMVTAGDIAYYLADAYDHLVALVYLTGHCNMMLSQAHSNYLARLSLEISEHTVKTSVSASRWTVVGTIIVPVNIVIGMWSLNVKVPFRDESTLRPFFILLGCCFAFVVLVLGIVRWKRNL